MTQSDKCLDGAAEFLRCYEDNMRLSGRLRAAAALLLLLVGLGWLAALASAPEPAALPVRLALAAAASAPFLALCWMLQRWGFEAKTLAYGFQRKAIVEEGLLRSAGGDAEFRKELLRIYLVHWMEKSPLEVMLALGGKAGMGGGASPTAALLGRAADSGRPSGPSGPSSPS